MERSDSTAKKYVPPEWCKPICKNSGNVACALYCAKNREAEYFLGNDEIPEFPYQQWKRDMSPQERQAVAGYYLMKIVEHLFHRKEELIDWDGITNGDMFEIVVTQGLLTEMWESGQ